MYITLFFNLLIILIAIIAVKNFSLGYLLILCFKMVVPYMVAFTVGFITISSADCCSIILLISYIIHKNNLLCYNYPNSLKKYFYVELISMLILIFLSSGLVPYSFQLISFTKYVFQSILFIYFGYYAFIHIDKVRALSFIFIVSIIAGIYGIFTYLIRINPYIELLYLNYTNSAFNLIEQFFSEERAGLIGRTSGTMTHPLAWGQYWTIISGVYLLHKRSINKYIGVLLLSVGVINVVLSGSRSSIVAFCILLVFYLLSTKFIHVLKRIFIFTIIIIGSLYTFKNNKTIDSFLGYIETAIFFWNQDISDNAGINGSSVSMRINQLETSLEYGLTNLGGLGYNFQLYVLEYPSKQIKELFGLESIVFKKLVEQGLIGLIIFICTTIILFKYIINGVFRHERMLLYGLFFSTLASILMTGIQGNSWMFFLVFMVMYKESGIALPKRV